MKNKSIYIIGFSIVGLGAYFVYKYMAKRKDGQTLSYPESVKEDVKSFVTNAPALTLTSYPLKNGSKGSNVVVLQKWLNDKGYASPKLVTDGAFGIKTQTAVKNMQNTPYDKAISDYFGNFNVSWKPSEVSQEFYDVFITKTKKAPIIGLSSTLKF